MAVAIAVDGNGLFAFHEMKSQSDQCPHSQQLEPVQGKRQDPCCRGKHCFRQVGVSCSLIPEFSEMVPGGKQALRVLSSATLSLGAQQLVQSVMHNVI